MGSCDQKGTTNYPHYFSLVKHEGKILKHRQILAHPKQRTSKICASPTHLVYDRFYDVSYTVGIQHNHYLLTAGKTSTKRSFWQQGELMEFVSYQRLGQKAKAFGREKGRKLLRL